MNRPTPTFDKLSAHLRMHFELDPNLVTVANNIDVAAQTILTWKEQTKGPRSNWTHHQKLREHHIFTDLKTAMNALTPHIQSIAPKHWDFDSFDFSFRKAADYARWCGKNGRAKGGVEMTLSTAGVLHFVGWLKGLAYDSGRPRRAQTLRMKALGFDTETVRTYRVRPQSYTHSWHLVQGHTPFDATAQAYAKGDISEYYKDNNLNALSEKEIFEQGIELGLRALRKSDVHWSADPTLWDAIAKTKTSKAQKTIGAKELIHKDVAGAHKEWERLDGLLKLILDTYTRNTVQKTKPFMVIDHLGFLHGQYASSPETAAAHFIMDRIQKGYIVEKVQDWQIHAIGDDLGAAWRASAPSPQEVE